MSYPIILSFDVGVINLSYCLLTKKEFTKESGEKYINFFIIDWAIINLTNRDEQKCSCGLPAKMTNEIDNNIRYYCKKHSKEVNVEYDSFENLFNINKENKCIYSKRLNQFFLSNKGTNRNSPCSSITRVSSMFLSSTCIICLPSCPTGITIRPPGLS